MTKYSINYAALDENVERGAQLMDRRDETMSVGFISERGPWFERTSLEQLNMGDGSCCIIGQEFEGEYYQGIKTLREEGFGNGHTSWEIQHGFVAPVAGAYQDGPRVFNDTNGDDAYNDLLSEEYAYLGKQWERQIQDRLIASGK